MIIVENVTMTFPLPRRYGEMVLHPFRGRRWTLALDGINLHIEDGERVAVLGPNGAGKTTLLKLIAGILYPTEGRVLVNGLDSTKQNLEARKSAAFITNEDRSFYWRLTGIENLQFFGSLDGFFGKELQHRIRETLAEVGLEELGDIRVSDYSSGMRQRLAIARGLLTDPDVLLLDEPTRSLDLCGALDIRQLLSSHLQSRRKRTLIVMTNNAGDAVNLCRTLCILNKKKIVARKDITTSDQAEVERFYHHTVGLKEAP